jgi:hypothetical protein
LAVARGQPRYPYAVVLRYAALLTARLLARPIGENRAAWPGVYAWLPVSYGARYLLGWPWPLPRSRPGGLPERGA